MKFKKIWGFLLLIISLGLLLACKHQEPVTFIIANDLHYLSPTLLGDGSFFSEIKSRSDGKVVHYSNEITDAFFDEVLSIKPKALVLAGDLTLTGAKASHEELVLKLNKLKEKGIDVLIIPGNHDIDNKAVDYSGDKLIEAPHLSSKEFIALYEQILPQNLISRNQETFSYIYALNEKIWLLLLDTNTYGKNFVKEPTYKWLEAELIKAKDNDITVISVTHQNLYAHSDLLSFGYTLYDNNELLELYTKYDVKVNLTAHIHIQSIIDEKIPEIATSSLSITGLHYGKVICDDKKINYEVDETNVTKYAEKNSLTDKNLLNFKEYANDFFIKVAEGHAKKTLDNTNLSDEDIELMAETYAMINTAYFKGEEIMIKDYEEGINLWNNFNNSTTKYIQSMLKNPQAKLQYTIKR